MGLSSSLGDTSSESLPILILISAVRTIAYLYSLLVSHPRGGGASSAAIGSNLAVLSVLAEKLSSSRPFSYSGEGERCVFCMDGIGEGERARRLWCCHVFHSECVDGWLFDRMKLSCPICRAKAAAEDRMAEAERRVGTELMAWLAPH